MEWKASTSVSVTQLCFVVDMNSVIWGGYRRVTSLAGRTC